MTLKEARAAGEMYYTGKVCKRHRELNGQRRASNGNCCKCIVERIRRKRKAEYKRRGYSPRPYRRKEKAAGAASTSG